MILILNYYLEIMLNEHVWLAVATAKTFFIELFLYREPTQICV